MSPKQQDKRLTGTSGSTARTSIEVDRRFTMEELMYVFGHKATIERLYKKLLLFYARNQSKGHQSPYKEWAEKNKVDFHLMPIMRNQGYADEDYNWLPGKPPSRGDAVFLQLKIREWYREAKEIKEE